MIKALSRDHPRGRDGRLFAVVVAFLCAACSRPSSASSPEHSRSLDTSGTPAATVFAIATPRPADCRGSQLTASLGESGPALGTEGVVILLHNTSPADCWLTGVPSLVGIDRHGHATHLSYRPATDPAQAVQPPGTGSDRLAADHYGALLLTECLADECHAPVTQYVTLRIGLAANQFVSMSWPTVMNLGSPGTETQAQPVPAPTGILGH
jgi:hypothetical protein